MIKTLAALAVLSVTTSVFALAPSYATFGNLPGATFGGGGIPTNPTAIQTFVDGNNTITLGLTAHQRYFNPALTNDGAGTFFATTGTNNGTPGNAGTQSTWNFAYYINIQGGGSLSDYSFFLGYDFNPAAGSSSGFGYLNLGALAELADADTTYQDSQNPTFPFLQSNLGIYVYAPANTFDANAAGEYSFTLNVSPAISYRQAGVSADAAPFVGGTIGINVVTGGGTTTSVPDSGSTLALFMVALGGIGFIARRRRHA